MNKYKLQMKIRAEYGDGDPYEHRSEMWSKVDEKVLESKVLDFPNPIKPGSSLRLNNDGTVFVRNVSEVYDNIKEGYSTVVLDPIKIRLSKKEEARESFRRKLETYSFIKDL